MPTPKKKKVTKKKVATKKLRQEPSLRAKKAMKLALENGGNVSKAMRDAGYSAAMSKNPQKLKKEIGWKALLDKFLPESLVAQRHSQLLNATRVDHMVFPLGPKGKDSINFSGGKRNQENKIEEHVERTTLTDDEIVEMLAQVDCTVKRIVHGETARHVYFWSADNRARKDALEMVHKLRGKYTDKVEVEHNIKTVVINKAK